MAVMNHKR